MSLAAHLARHPRLSGWGRDFVLNVEFHGGAAIFGFFGKTGEAEFLLPGGRGQEAALQALLRKFAEQVLPPRVHELAGRHGLRVRQVHVRDQGSRWGSCSTTGTLSLNWRLVLLPVLLHNYVLLHELAHLTEMNHSDAFWNLLREYDPQSGRARPPAHPRLAPPDAPWPGRGVKVRFVLNHFTAKTQRTPRRP